MALTQSGSKFAGLKAKSFYTALTFQTADKTYPRCRHRLNFSKYLLFFNDANKALVFLKFFKNITLLKNNAIHSF